MGLKEPIPKIILFIIGYNISELKYQNFLFLIQAETKIVQLCKFFKILVKRETPGGICDDEIVIDANMVSMSLMPPFC